MDPEDAALYQEDQIRSCFGLTAGRKTMIEPEDNQNHVIQHPRSGSLR